MNQLLVVGLFCTALAITALLVRSVTGLLHEAGNAIVALLLTSGPVDVYLGTRGDTGLNFSLGRFTLHFKYQSFRWLPGITWYQSEGVSAKKHLAIIVSGTILSLSAGFGALFLAYTFPTHFLVKMISILFFASSFYDALADLIANEGITELDNEKLGISDGQKLMSIYHHHKVIPPEYFQANREFDQKEFEKAAARYQQLIDQGQGDIYIYGGALSAYTMNKDLNNAERIWNEYKDRFELTAADYLVAGFMFMEQNKPDEAEKWVEAARALEPDNIDVLVDLGLCKERKGEFEEALKCYERVLDIDINSTIALNNMGYTLGLNG